MSSKYYNLHLADAILTKQASFDDYYSESEGGRISFTLTATDEMSEEEACRHFKRMQNYWDKHPGPKELLDVFVRTSKAQKSIQFVLPMMSGTQNLDMAVAIICEYRSAKSDEMKRIAAALTVSWNAYVSKRYYEDNNATPEVAQPVEINNALSNAENRPLGIRHCMIDEICCQLHNLFMGDDCVDYRHYFSKISIDHPKTKFHLCLVRSQTKASLNVFVSANPADVEALFAKISTQWLTMQILLNEHGIYYLNSIDLQRSEDGCAIQFMLPFDTNKQVLALLNIAIFALYKANASKSMVPYCSADLFELNAALVDCWNRSISIHQLDAQAFQQSPRAATSTKTSIYASRSTPMMFQPVMLQSPMPPLPIESLLSSESSSLYYSSPTFP